MSRTRTTRTAAAAVILCLAFLAACTPSNHAAESHVSNAVAQKAGWLAGIESCTQAREPVSFPSASRNGRPAGPATQHHTTCRNRDGATMTVTSVYFADVAVVSAQTRHRNLGSTVTFKCDFHRHGAQWRPAAGCFYGA